MSCRLNRSRARRVMPLSIYGVFAPESAPSGELRVVPRRVSFVPICGAEDYFFAFHFV